MGTGDPFSLERLKPGQSGLGKGLDEYSCALSPAGGARYRSDPVGSGLQMEPSWTSEVVEGVPPKAPQFPGACLGAEHRASEGGRARGTIRLACVLGQLSSFYVVCACVHVCVCVCACVSVPPSTLLCSASWNVRSLPGMMAHTCNLSTWKAEE